MRYTLIRERIALDDLPDEVIEQIVGLLSPVELCTCGWEVVSSGFAAIIRTLLSRTRCLDAVDGADREFFQQFTIEDRIKDTQRTNKLHLVVNKLSPYLTNLTLNAAVFSKMLEFVPSTSERSLLFPHLRSLHVFVGNLCGSLTSRISSGQARRFASELKSIEVTVNLSSESDTLINCCNFKALLKLLSVFMGAAGGYVRAVIDMGISLQLLELIDDLKMSPYMIVMQKQRRFLYMYDEFKRCEHLVVCYDIGIVAPSFHSTQSAYTELKRVELVASHVLCKNDLVLYLSDAPNLVLLRILQPPHWVERVKRCTYGCFRNEDYGCFMDWGWATVPTRLPHTCLRFDCCSA
uniref:F-box domain-containing protein n=1 Tax=Ascaris lumbricoides TaxID=6252 RepID=A0A0M3IFQ2_ASCLU